MAVKIRLSRVGKKHVPFYRIVAINSQKKRDGACFATIGTYDALKSSIVCFNETLYNEWLSKGAQPTDSAKKVYKLYKKTQAASKTA
jgi:small subunit ribosomal protein S16